MMLEVSSFLLVATIIVQTESVNCLRELSLRYYRLREKHTRADPLHLLVHEGHFAPFFSFGRGKATLSPPANHCPSLGPKRRAHSSGSWSGFTGNDPKDAGFLSAVRQGENGGWIIKTWAIHEAYGEMAGMHYHGALWQRGDQSFPLLYNR